MEICPKGIFIPILHLPVQVKLPKENIRTKRETSDAYSEHCQTAKRKLFGILDVRLGSEYAFD